MKFYYFTTLCFALEFINSLKTTVLAQFGLNMTSFENIGQFSIKFENKTFKFNISPQLLVALQDSIISKKLVFSACLMRS